MPVTSSDVRLYYEVFGAESDPLLVLASGGGAQMISWDEEFISLLTRGGLRVVRFDNRDTGYSERFGGQDDLDGGYELADLGDDIVRIMDDLGVQAAHIAGHSMGGMMTQMVALEHPERVRSLGLFSTLPGQDPRYVLHSSSAGAPRRITRDEAVELAGAAASATDSRYDPQVAWHRTAAGTAYDRGYFPEGAERQLAALRRAPERLERLRDVRVPTLIVHGREDPVVHWSAAADMAAAMSGSELQIHPEVGHLLPHELWPDLTRAILRTADRARERA